jgi:hypothetical protein
MKSFLFVCLLSLFTLSVGAQGLFLTGNPPRNNSLEIVGSGMQHYSSIRHHGKEKFVLWPVIQENGRNRYISELDSNYAIFGFLPNGKTLKINKMKDSASSYLTYNFEEEGFHIIYLIHKFVKNNTLVIQIAKANRLSHKCRNGHSGIQKKIDWKSHPEIVDFEIIRNPIHLEDFHTILKSGNEISLLALFMGQPSEKTKINIETSKEWTKKLETNENGEVKFQLITDQFKPIFHVGKKEFYMLITSSKTIDSLGVYNGQEFSKIIYHASLEQEYTFADETYKSKLWGFIVFFVSVIIISFLVFLYRRKRSKYTF